MGIVSARKIPELETLVFSLTTRRGSTALTFLGGVTSGVESSEDFLREELGGVDDELDSEAPAPFFFFLSAIH